MAKRDGWVPGTHQWRWPRDGLREGPWDSQGGTNGHEDQIEGTWTAMGDELGDSSVSMFPPLPRSRAQLWFGQSPL